jgi:methylphosphotriester-DNA--protein-cysteine methyltransferase
MSTRQLAAKYDVSKTAVLQILHREQVIRPREQISQQQLQQAQQLMEHGLSINKTAAELGIASSTLRYQLKQRGRPAHQERL